MVENRQNDALAIVVVFAVVATLFVGARTLSRFLGRNFGWDDWLIHASLLLLFGETLTTYKYILLSHTGYHGRDIPKQTVEQKVEAGKWSFAVQLFYHPLMGAIRASIIMFLFRIKDRRLPIRIALHVVFWINIGYMVSTTIVNIFQCTPVRYAFSRAQMDQEVDADGNIITHGHCIDSLAFILASCSLSIFMDLIIMPIPTAMVWGLHMQRKTKVAVVIIMSMGWIATAVSIGRFIVYYYRFSPSQKDKSYDIGVVISIAEPAVGIIAACAPAMKCLFKHLMPRYFDSADGNSYNTQSPTQKSIRHHSFNIQFGMGKDIEAQRMDNFTETRDGMTPLKSIDSRDQMDGMAPNMKEPIWPPRGMMTGHNETHIEGGPKNI
ncbi:hypothetical protein P154DRAFT_483892 [Amniculicola lignicola CBS 123094]|uniref:Rhodopsin domain-containing protein n=1 Tax=Amniculicola lignicola CBS 123094 TaxID=1392246 RepID=A0A6A5WUH0_9PLEO|nr:hypothetical protein P154DRAFT_483892 [Amniculicola lignicola CBS 123094]